MPDINGTTQMKMYEAFVNGVQDKRRTSDNTVVDDMGGVREVRLHGNPIAIWRRSGTLTLSCCGWASPTTMRKLNCICENLWRDGIIPMLINWHVVKGETVAECEGYSLTTGIIVVKNVESLERPNPAAYVVEVMERKMAEAAARQRAPLQFDNMLEAL